MKIASIVVILVLAIALAVGTFFYIQQSNNQQKLSYQVTGLQQEVKELEKSNALIENSRMLLEQEKSELLVNTGQLSQENESLSKDIAKQEEQIKSLSDDVGNLTKDLDEKKASASKLQSENISLKSKFMCERTLSSVDFTNNETVNKSLVTYVDSTKSRTEPISAHYWKIIWTGEKYSTHTIEVYSEKENMVYLWKFSVYFRGEGNGIHENGVFYNDHQCWMYLDK